MKTTTPRDKYVGPAVTKPIRRKDDVLVSRFGLGKGRPYKLTTPLGKLIYQANMRIYDVAMSTAIQHHRISDYLRNAYPMLPVDHEKLADFFHVHPDELIPDFPTIWKSAQDYYNCKDRVAVTELYYTNIGQWIERNQND